MISRPTHPTVRPMMSWLSRGGVFVEVNWIALLGFFEEV